MIYIYLLIYTLLLVGVWGFFIVAKLHTYKFRNFSSYIGIVTSSLAIFLVFLSIIGYVFIFFIGHSDSASSGASLPIKKENLSSKNLFKDLDLNEITY